MIRMVVGFKMDDWLGFNNLIFCPHLHLHYININYLKNKTKRCIAQYQHLKKKKPLST